MVRRALLITIGSACAVSALVFAGIASPAVKSQAAAPATVSCSIPVQIGMMGPFTGPAASIGDDQLHWALYAANVWNASHKTKIQIVQGDTQLNPAIASTVSQSFASNSSIVGVIGPAGSQEVIAVGSDPEEGGLRVHLRIGDQRHADEREAEGLLLPRRPERRRPGPDGRQLT